MRGSILLTILLAFPTLAAAQHHGGHGMGGSIGSASGGRPTGVDEKDSLKDFHQALAVQASSQQIAEFQEVVKTTNLAADAVAAFQEQSAHPGREGVGSLDQTLENARSRNKQFLAGFSEVQKSGLKETTKRLEKSDSDLEQESKRLDQSLSLEATATEVGGRAESLHKALSDFSEVQLALGREMGITLASGEDLAFDFPVIRIPLHMARRDIEIRTGGNLTQTDVTDGLRTFHLRESADLSELQQNLAEILTVRLASPNACGDRFSVKRAVLTANEPASSLELLLHFERWSCTRMPGQTSEELGEADGTVEMKLSPSWENGGLRLAAAIKRIDATGMMGQELHAGDAGDDLRDQSAKTILTAIEAAIDFKKTLPPVLQTLPRIHSARFQGFGPGEISLVEEGDVKLSSDQINALASQINQLLSAHAGSPK